MDLSRRHIKSLIEGYFHSNTEYKNEILPIQEIRHDLIAQTRQEYPFHVLC